MKIILCKEAYDLPDFFPQILTVTGTITGTILGWLLHRLSDSVGKAEIIKEKYINYISKNKEYAYVLKLFLCNHSLSPKFIKNPQMEFYNKRQLIFTQELKETDNDNLIDIKNKKNLK